MSDAPPTTQTVTLDRLRPADWNPRTIEDINFRRLMEAIRSDPTFMEERPVLAMQDGTIYGGNQRYRAVEALYGEGWESPWGNDTIPARLADIAPELAKARALRDNNQWGEWEADLLADMVADIHREGRTAVMTLGFEPDEIRELLLSAGVTPDDPTFDESAIDPELIGGRGGVDAEPPPPGEQERPPSNLLALVNVTIAEPSHTVATGDVWTVGPHTLICCNVMTEWTTWQTYLQDGDIFAPYPGPFTPLTNRGQKQRIVMVQPDPYIAGHILDRYAEQHGVESVARQMADRPT